MKRTQINRTPTTIGQMGFRIRQITEELLVLYRSGNPNIGTVQRLEREKEKLQERLYEKKVKNKAKREAKKSKKAKPLPKENKKRKAKLREEQYSIADGYRDFIVKQPFCANCGRHTPNGCDPAHLRDKSIGGGPEYLLHLCRWCHQFEEVKEKEFALQFHLRTGMSPVEYAMAMREAFILERDERK